MLLSFSFGLLERSGRLKVKYHSHTHTYTHTHTHSHTYTHTQRDKIVIHEVVTALCVMESR